jgi:hypothetical protein
MPTISGFENSCRTKAHHQRRNTFRLAPRTVASERPLVENDRRRHHDRQMDRHQLRQHNESRFTVKPADERNAQQHQIGKACRHTRDNARARVPAKAGPDYEMRCCPGHQHGGEIGQPKRPGRAVVEACGDDGAKQQKRHRDGEDKIRQPVAGLALDQPHPGGAKANGNQRKDDQDRFNKGRHGHETQMGGGTLFIDGEVHRAKRCAQIPALALKGGKTSGGDRGPGPNVHGPQSPLKTCPPA